MNVAVLVPVLNRPARVKPTLDLFKATTPDARVLFIADPYDTDELTALNEAEADYITYEANYAQKIHEGVERTTEPLIFSAADDLEPQDGWFEKAKACLRDGIKIVGVNDLLPRRRNHQTHFLMTREYAETPTIDGNPGPFHEGYCHWWQDDELIQTAKHRGVYAYAADSIVKHLHYMNNTAPFDSTYKKGRANWRLDHMIYMQRAHLWT